MDIIFIRNLVFSGTHGVHTREKSEKQNFGIDLELSVDTNAALASDRIQDAVDYTPVKAIVKDIIENHSYNLIETIVHTIVDRILADRRISSVSITLRKLEIWGNGIPGISVIKNHSA